MSDHKLLKKISQIFIATKNYLDGDFAYQNYLRHLRESHKMQKALDKKSFLRRREQEKWNKVNRCC